VAHEERNSTEELFCQAVRKRKRLNKKNFTRNLYMTPDVLAVKG
jgi:hypothetical protein